MTGDIDLDIFLAGEVPMGNKTTGKQQAAQITTNNFITCGKCGGMKEVSCFYRSKSFFFAPKGRAPICKSCLQAYIGDGSNLVNANKLCQYLDIAFEPNVWLGLLDKKKDNIFDFYYDLYNSSQNKDVDWSVVNSVWKKKAENLELLASIEMNKETRYEDLRKIWGDIYTSNELDRLEKYFLEIEQTQNVNTAIQRDNARKMSKLSLKLDQMIEQNDTGTNIKNIVGAIDSLAKSADFTTKSAKNIGDFDSVGELFGWLEKKGWLNSFYDWEPKDEVDKVMKNIQAYCKRIVVGETNLASDVEKKMEALNIAQVMEDDMSDAELDNYDNVEIDSDLQSEFDEEFDTGDDA